MIRPIDIKLNAAHPELKLLETVTYTGSPATVFIRGVPPSYGRWAITAVFVAATFPDGSTTTRAAVQSANGVWVATLPATATSGRTMDGFRVIADGIDENGEAATGYILAVADFAVASLDVTPAPEPGETSYQMLYFDEVPSTLRKGDVAKIDGVLKFYNGSAWEPFAASITLDNAVTPTSANGVKSSGIWSMLWGALSALPTGFTSLYDWVVDQLAGKQSKITASGVLKGDGAGGVSAATAGTDFQAPLSQTQIANIAAVSDALAFDATHSYAAGDPVVYDGTLYTFTATHTGAWTGTDASAVDIIARLAGKANDNAVVHLTGEETVGGIKTFTGYNYFYDFTVSHPQGQGYIRIHASANENRVRIEFYDAVTGSQGELFLPVLGGYGAVTLAAIENLAPDAFPMLYDGVIVDLNTLYCYQGRLYRCILGYTFQSGDGYPSDDTTHWTLATVEDVLAALRTAIAGKADVSAIPYDLVTKTISNNAVTLDDRASNAVTISTTLSPNTLTVNFPTATSGKARDFGLRLTVASGVTTAPELALPQGVTCENADGEAPEIGADGAATILYFTETASGVFLVKGEVVTAIS